MRFFLFLFIFLTSLQSKAEDYLIIGDSHVFGGFGESLQNQLSKRGARVSRYGLVGASPIHYLDKNSNGRTLRMGGAQSFENGLKIYAKSGEAITMPPLDKLILKHKPKVLIMEFGDNMADYKNQSLKGVKANIQKQSDLLKKLLEQTTPRPNCVWITHTYTDKEGKNAYSKTNKRAKEVAEIIKNTAGRYCQVIDSTQDLKLSPNSLKTSSDGLHFNPSEGEKWAAAVINKLFEKSTEMSSDCGCGL